MFTERLPAVSSSEMLSLIMYNRWKYLNLLSTKCAIICIKIAHYNMETSIYLLSCMRNAFVFIPEL